MKKNLLLIAMALISVLSRAAVINVSNSPTAPVNVPHTYNDLQVAINAAADGDSLYVHGTNISYGNITITNRTLTFIGAGYGSNLQSNFQQRSRLGNVEFLNYSGSRNIVFVGLLIEGELYTTGTNAPVSNLIIERCAVNKMTCQSNNLIIRQSLFEYSDYTIVPFAPTVFGNAIIQNSVFVGAIGAGLNLGSSLWENNIFKMAYPYYNAYGDISGINGTGIFKNNIFNNEFTISVSNCTFNNNLFVSVSSLGNGNSGTGNVFSTGAGFVNNYNPVNTIGKQNYCSAVDYHLSVGSAALTAGPTGNEIGIYGGTNALPASAVLNGVPAMPRITEMNLQNISVAPNGSLNVQLKAVKEN